MQTTIFLSRLQQVIISRFLKFQWFMALLAILLALSGFSQELFADDVIIVKVGNKGTGQPFEINFVESLLLDNSDVQGPQGNASIIMQMGTANQARVRQLRAGNVARGNMAIIKQQGTSNEANIIQSGGNNIALVGQYGDSHRAFIKQSGSSFEAQIKQVGYESNINVSQSGSGYRRISVEQFSSSGLGAPVTVDTY